MDLFDDIPPGGPTARAGPRSKFAPKVKSKKSPRKEISASEHATSHTSKDSEKNSQNICHNAVAGHPQLVELQNLEVAENSQMGNPQQVNVNIDTAHLVDELPFTTTLSEAVADQNFTNFPKSPSKADSVGFEVGSITKSIPEIDLNNGTTQPVHPANAVENGLNNVAAPSTTFSTIGRMEELPKSGEGSFLDSPKSLEIIDNSLQVRSNMGFKNASDENNIAISDSNIHSNFDFGQEREVFSAEFELHPFSNVLLDPVTKNAHKFQPKIKQRPKLGNTPAVASTSSTVMMENISFQSSGDANHGLDMSTNLPLPTSEDNISLEEVIPSLPDSLNTIPSEAVAHSGTKDWPSSFGNSAAETADIFMGLDSLDGFLTQAATVTGKPVLISFNEKGREENFAIPVCSSINSFGVSDDTTQVQSCPGYHTNQDSLTFNEARVVNEDDSCTKNSKPETQEVTALNHDSQADNVFHCQSLKFGTDPTSEVPLHEELTNSADSPTLADFLHQDVTGEKEDANEIKNSLRKHRKSSITGVEDGGKTSKRPRKQASQKPAISLNEDVGDDDDLDPLYNSKGDELEGNDDEYEADNSFEKKRAPRGSKMKSVAKNGKTSKKREKANDDSEKTMKKPPKSFPHSTRRKKRCVDKALLEDDELDYRTLSMRDLILIADYKERLKKKEATTSKESSPNQSGGNIFLGAGANNEDGIFGSQDPWDQDDDHASERITSTAPLSTAPLLNYHTFSDKAPRVKWSKQDTALFYKAVRECGPNFELIQLVHFPDRTRHQVMLKYKKEERQHPLQLSDAAFINRATDCSHFESVIEKLQQASGKVEHDPSRDASEFMPGDEVEDPTLGTNEEVGTAEQGDANVKDQEDSTTFHSPEQSDESDDDLNKWSEYKSDF